MLKFFAISLFTSVALAQSSATPTPSPSSTASSAIPSGISAGCSTFLNSLNGDANLNTCISTLINATAAYGPGGSAATSPSSANIGSTLENLCSTSTSNSCPENLIRGKIADFYSACPAELTANPNSDVLEFYDILYTVTPLKTTVCSKNNGGDYCVTKPPASNDSPTQIQKYLAQSTSTLLPNMTTFHDNNLLFLFWSASSTGLCTDCTRAVLTAYIDFESNVPYAPGLNKSSLLDSQSDLYTGVVNTCGKDFLSGAVQAAGGLSGGTLSSGAVQIVGVDTRGFIAIGMGMLTLAFFSAL